MTIYRGIRHPSAARLPFAVLKLYVYLVHLPSLRSVDPQQHCDAEEDLCGTRKWVDDKTFTDRFALGNALLGPSFSQV
ncbi:hypothetical protein JB92DRAFT_1902521 [Gautieria morchelliformis]|nr:hypothetical protein JB92DRAFT_1902521 [Gautieria morchelliformis]